MTVIADALQKAIDEKKNDLKSFIWKGEKKLVNGVFVQEEIKMDEATPEQLQAMYNRCIIMLYNPSKKNPGRYVLEDEIEEQIENCNAELFLRYLEHGDPLTGANPIPRFSYFQSLKTFLDNNEEALPRNSWSEKTITYITKVPTDFSRLSIERVYLACLDSLGVFNRKHLTNNFITSLGIWLTNKELQELTEHDSEGKIINRLKLIRTHLNLKPYVHIFIKNGGLSFKEFRAMITLQTKKYSELTTDQLTILRNTILYKLEEEVRHHAEQWENRMEQIKKVCDSKNIQLITDIDTILANDKK